MTALPDTNLDVLGRDLPLVAADPDQFLELEWCNGCSRTDEPRDHLGDPDELGMPQRVVDDYADEDPITHELVRVTQLECGHVIVHRRTGEVTRWL